MQLIISLSNTNVCMYLRMYIFTYQIPIAECVFIIKFIRAIQVRIDKYPLVDTVY